MNDAIPICRSIFKHWIYQDAEYLKVWLTMLGRARYQQDTKTVIYEKALCVLTYGDFIFGYKAWSENLKIPYQRLRGLIKKLLTDNMIKVKTQTSNYTVYEIINYEKFNSQSSQQEQGLNDDDNSRVTVGQQSGNSRVTTNEEGINKDKKDKEDIPYAAIIDYLNNTCHTKFRLVEGNKKHIKARWAEGYKIADFETVIKNKAVKWLNTEQSVYLRPETLFGTKFDGYLNEVSSAKPQEERIDERGRLIK